MRLLSSVLFLAAVLAGCSRRSEAPTANTSNSLAFPVPSLAVTVDADGKIFLEGIAATVQSFQESLPSLKERGGYVVLRYPQTSPAAQATAQRIAKAVVQAGLSMEIPDSSNGPPKSIEERLDHLQRLVDGDAAKPDEAALAREAAANLAEIRSLGLVDRAMRDFAARRPGSKILSSQFAYFQSTNLVWCNFSFSRPDQSEPLQQEFGYRRGAGTNWTLIWDDRGTQ